MQALPYATQLLARLGADVVKIEAPTGESGRGSQPGMTDPEGRFIGATFLRNNLSKRSVTVNLKDDRGRELVLALAPHFDVCAENFKSGALDRIGLLVGHPEWPTDPRLATREGWAEHLEDMLRPAIEAWASTMTRMEAVAKLSAAGIASAPVQRAPEVVADPHLRERHMLVEM